MDVTLKTVREAKKELEQKIKIAIDEFRMKTNDFFKIDSIKVNMFQMANGSYVHVVDTNIDVKLESNI